VVAPDGHAAADTVTRLGEWNQLGQFEPVGTHRVCRRRRLARAMAPHALKALGEEHAWSE